MLRPEFRRRDVLIWALAVLLLVALSILPILLQRFFEPGVRFSDSARLVAMIVALGVPLGAAWLCYRRRLDLGRSQKNVLFLLLILLTFFVLDLHQTQVDWARQFVEFANNTLWQEHLHRMVVRLDPGVIPHSYRFLPDGFTGLIEVFTDFTYARLMYRCTFMFLLLFSIYYFARLYASHAVAVIVVLLYVLVYPASIRFYAGQLTDPMSHLSFVLGYIFFELNVFTLFALSIFVGCMAKESIVLLIPCYLLLRRGDHGYRLKSIVLIGGAVAILALIRWTIKPSNFGYQDVSGVSLAHVIRSLEHPFWPRQVFFTLGIFVPFVVLGWKNAQPTLRGLVAIMAPGLLLSSVFFSWFHEARNFIPAVVPMALIATEYVRNALRPSGDGPA